MGKKENSFIKILHKRIPIFKWGPRYNTTQLTCDMIAGITVALTVMPQGLAYATLAGLEPQYGLYSAFVGCFIYTIFGSCKDITIGPTALMALMTYQQTVDRNTDYAVLLCFLTGAVQMIMAILHLGVLIDFISVPVTVGFTSATSVIIAVSQIKSLLGLKFASAGFLDTLCKIFQNLHNTRLNDSILGFTCIAVLLVLRKIKDIKKLKVNTSPTKIQRNVSRLIWLISTSRNALVVIICSTISYVYQKYNDESLFYLTGTVKSGLPELRIPPFETNLHNRTVEFTEMVSDLGASVVLVPIIGVLGNVAIAKAFASGQGVDATQELLTLSLCNILGSFFSSMPITGSFSRSAVNHASGVKTPFGGVFTGIMVLLALSFLTPYFAFIPKASLAAVIICAVIFMIEYEVVKPMWRSNKKDLVPTFATFLMCLIVGVEIGIVIGVGINIIFLLYPSARPTIVVDKRNTSSGIEYILVTPGNSLYFPAVDFIKTSVGKVASSSSHLPVVLDCRFVLGADFTAAKGILALTEEFLQRKQPLYFLNPREDVIAVFKGAVEDNFQYIMSDEELHQILKDNQSMENRRLLTSAEDNGIPGGSLIELSEICSESTNFSLNHRKT